MCILVVAVRAWLDRMPPECFGSSTEFALRAELLDGKFHIRFATGRNRGSMRPSDRCRSLLKAEFHISLRGWNTFSFATEAGTVQALRAQKKVRRGYCEFAL